MSGNGPRAEGPIKKIVTVDQPNQSDDYFLALACAVALAVGIGGLLLGGPATYWLLVAFGVFFLAMIVPSIRHTRQWSGYHGEFEFDEWPLKIGTSATVTFRLRTEGSPRLAAMAIDLSWSCSEAATYVDGTDETTEVKILYRLEETVASVRVGNDVEAKLPFTIPIDRGAPSLDLPSNKIRWSARASVGEAKKKKYWAAEVQVLAVVDREALGLSK